MKQTLRLRGELCPKNKQCAKILYTIFIAFTIVLVSCVCTRAQVSASSQEAGPAAEAVSEIKPLEIGDTIPDALWNMPLNMVKAEQEGTSTVTLNDYKGKLIILDFWATWCSSCIAEMPKIHSMAKEFENELIVLPVTKEDEAKATNFLKNNSALKDLDIVSVIGKNELGTYFPHRWLPHMVWIAMDGTVLATSSSNEVTEENIKSALESKVRDLSKIDIDYNQHLFSDPALKDKNTLVYSVFIKGYQPGLPVGNIFRKTEDGKVHGLAIYNATIGTIYSRLYRFLGEKALKDDIVLKVKDPSAIWYNEELSKDREWRENNLYTYELTLPVDQADFLFKRMIEDMDRYSGYHSRIENGRIELSD